MNFLEKLQAAQNSREVTHVTTRITRLKEAFESVVDTLKKVEMPVTTNIFMIDPAKPVNSMVPIGTLTIKRRNRTIMVQAFVDHEGMELYEITQDSRDVAKPASWPDVESTLARLLA